MSFDNPPGLDNLGLFLLDSGYADAARATLSRAAEVDPFFPHTWRCPKALLSIAGFLRLLPPGS